MNSIWMNEEGFLLGRTCENAVWLDIEESESSEIIETSCSFCKGTQNEDKGEKMRTFMVKDNDTLTWILWYRFREVPGKYLEEKLDTTWVDLIWFESSSSKEQGNVCYLHWFLSFMLAEVTDSQRKWSILGYSWK